MEVIESSTFYTVIFWQLQRTKAKLVRNRRIFEVRSEEISICNGTSEVLGSIAPGLGYCLEAQAEMSGTRNRFLITHIEISVRDHRLWLHCFIWLDKPSRVSPHLLPGGLKVRGQKVWNCPVFLVWVGLTDM